MTKREVLYFEVYVLFLAELNQVYLRSEYTFLNLHEEKKLMSPCFDIERLVLFLVVYLI